MRVTEGIAHGRQVCPCLPPCRRRKRAVTLTGHGRPLRRRPLLLANVPLPLVLLLDASSCGLADGSRAL